MLAVAMLAAVAWFGHGYVPAWQDASVPSYPRISHPAGVYATSSASAAPTGPFEGTPAGEYPKGEDGLAMPEAVALDGWSKNEVADVLGKVRQIMAGVYLDRRALVDHDPAALLPLMAPSAREYVAKLYHEPGQARGLLISKKIRLAEEPAEHIDLFDVPHLIGTGARDVGRRDGNVKVDAAVGPSHVVVPGAVGQDALKVAAVPDQDPVQALGPHGAHPALRVGVCFRAIGERGNALLKMTFKALRNVSLDPWRIGRIVAAALVLLHFDHVRTT